jgi:hypothetical protein
MESPSIEVGTTPLLVNDKGLSKLTNISPRHIKNLAKAGVLPSIKLGHRCVRYSPADCMAALKSRFEAKVQKA